MRLNSADWRAIEAELCSRSLAEYAKLAWPVLEPITPLKWGWVLDAICEHLEAVTRGEISRLLINVPPGTMKSLLAGVIWPSWEWGPKGLAHLRYLGTAHKQDLAVRDNLRCRRLIQSEWYQDMWPLALTGDQNAKTKFENNATGFREAMAFTSMTGSRGDRVLLDDPHSVDDANSSAHLDAGVKTFREALPSRVNNEESAIVIVMQRLHEKDVSAAALELGYEHLCVPMRYEGESRTKTFLGWKDPRTKEGELMFPERFGEEQVQELERSLGTYATAGQLQQQPAPAGGGIFRQEWLQVWSVLPEMQYRMIYVDTAQKTAERNDWTVFELWGKGRDGKIYLLDIMRDKWEAPALLINARAFWNKHKGADKVVTGPGISAKMRAGVLRKMGIEDKSSGTGLIQQLKTRGPNGEVPIPVKAIQRERDKVSRAHDVVPQIEAGNVLFHPDHEHMSVMFDELKKFPNAKNDDTVDPMMDAIEDMLITETGGFFTTKRT